MSDDHSHDDHGQHLEVWPDAGITETNFMPPAWIWAAWIISAVSFTIAVSNQFWKQTEETPNFGPGWHAVESAENYPKNKDGVRVPHPSPSDALMYETTSNIEYNRKESECYWGNFGMRR
ncbi:MAG: hypothetical protein KDB07_09455 [Planctomycetes bacterium]|nr:hypothetical protein [Planctomycetota bacterium]